MAAPYLPTIGAPFPAGIDLQGSELARVTLWNVTIASGLLPIDGALGYRTNAGDKGPIFYDSAIAAEERLVRRSLHEAIGGQYQFNYNSGAPFTVVNQTVVTNLNADLLDGYNSSATAVQNTIPIYSTGGTLFVSTPTLGGHAVNKDYADALNYTLFYSPVVYLAGNGIKKTGVTFSVKINGDDSYLTNSIIYASSSSVLNETALNATATNKFLRQVSSGVPSFEQVLAADIGSGAALTKGDDTNVTLTLGGTPTTALLAAASITAGWTGTLGVAPGGTNFG